MLQAHSLLWHYLWVAPNLLLLVLAVLIWRRKLHKQYPVFLLFAVVTAIEQLTVYIADVLPSVSPAAWWHVFFAGLLLEAPIKFVLIGEIFGLVFGMYPSLAKLAKLLVSGTGVVLVFLAAVIAAYTPKNSIYWIVSGAHVFEQTIYLIECGLILFLFLFAAYFKLRWSRSSFGMALGLGISACVHLATWALMANPDFSAPYHVPLVFLNMTTYHVCVLIWFYYLLLPQKSLIMSPATPPENNLELWNRELERLLQQ
ncbi:MAG: hypothetical protein WB799_13640 [Candidatus Sulfotelmatobacter sp.]